MSIGETVQLTAAVLDQNGQPVSGVMVSWSSSDETVATVSSQGLVTAVGNGTATITARSGSVSQNASVTVRQTVASITIEPAMATLMSIGETVQLTATVLDENGQPVSGAVISWSSSDETVATVSSQGLVTAVGNGTATITARTGNASQTAAVTVRQTVASITIEPAMATLMSIGETVQLTATVLDENGQPVSGAVISWSSSDETVATVSNEGLVTAVMNGSATITARTGNASQTAAVTVRQTVASITIEPAMATLMSIGETVQLTATVLDENGQPVSGAVISWSSSDETVATVSNEGLVTAVMNGSATITARAGNASQTAAVTVRQTVASITIEPDMATLMSIGETVQLTAAGLDENGQPVSGAVISWSSSDETVATVSEGGLVTSVMNGTATITARVGTFSATTVVTVLVPRTDRDALVAFYESAGGEHWSNKANWLSVHSLDTWYGVKVNDEGRVTEIDLPNNNLRGSLTSEVGYLEELAVLRVDRNQLTGHIPPELGMLTRLQRLVLSSNQFTGAIPPELGQLTGLEVLLLSSNRLSGSIPAELGDLAGLTNLSLSVNELVGPIPGELGRLERLTSLRLDQNRLTGPIPVELSGLTGLQVSGPRRQ